MAVGASLLTLTMAMLSLSGCGDGRPEVTIEDQLESIAGEQLTPAEIQRRLDIADTLCQTNVDILERMWKSMSAQQLRFQDFVFGTRCPERSVEYATATGRALTAEAHQYLVESTTTTAAVTGQTLSLPDSLTGSTTTSTTQP